MTETSTDQEASISQQDGKSPQVADAPTDEAGTEVPDTDADPGSGGPPAASGDVAEAETTNATAENSEDNTDSAGSADDSDGADGEAAEAAVTGEALLVQEGEIAGDYLEQLLDILDYDGDIDLDVEGSRAIVAIVGAKDLDPLVGARGVTLDALQELTRLTVAQQTGVRTRLMLDIGGYRAGRRTELSDLATTSVARVIDTGETVRMSPMNAFERKIVHDVVTATDGVHSESEGEDPDRRVVILPD